MSAPQSYANHTRYNPLFHYFLLPMLGLNFFFSIALFFRHHHQHPHITVWWIVLSFVLIMVAGNGREGALKAQDRVIRLEERLRLKDLLPSVEHGSIDSLTTGQLVALRFASDEELPALVRRALKESLTPKQIKQAVVSWRPDYQRV